MRRNTSRTTINPMSFASLLSDLKTATGVATGGSTGGDTESNASNGGANATQPSTSDEVDPTSKVDPSFTPSVVKECIERMLRVQQMRRSFAASTASSSVGGECAGGASDGRRTRTSRSAPRSSTHSPTRRFGNDGWRPEGSSAFAAAPVVSPRPQNCTCTPRIQSGSDPRGCGKSMLFCGVSPCHTLHPATTGLRLIPTSPRSKTLPVTHRPEWNDVRIVRAILSLIAEALKDARTTHILLCTGRCGCGLHRQAIH